MNDVLPYPMRPVPIVGEKPYSPAVLLVVFNRPDVTSQVLEAVIQARPRKLYVVGDGPRISVESDRNSVAATQEIFLGRGSWDFPVDFHFRTQNVGLKRNVVEAVSWFFERESEGIILEDDCLPDPTFFPFAAELLERFRDDQRVMQISGNSFFPERWSLDHSYYTTEFAHIWGWATWRRSWDDYRRFLTLDGIPQDDIKRLAHQMGVNPRNVQNSLRAIFQDETTTWDRAWSITCLLNHGLTVFPSRNLVLNIGFGRAATHTHRRPIAPSIHPPLESIDFPISHPPHRIPNDEAQTFQTLVFLGFRGSLMRTLARIVFRFFGFRANVFRLLFRRKS